MAMKILSREATMRLMGFANNPDIKPPAKITEHKERIETWTQALEAKLERQGNLYQYEVDMVVRLKMRLDGMYCDWAEGVMRTRWCDLPTKPDLCVEDIILETVYDTESVYNNHGVEVLAMYLEILGYEGIFKRLVERYLLDIRSLLEEAVPFEIVAGVLADPRFFFGTKDDQEARDLTVEHFLIHVDAASPEHVKWAMMAYIEFGLGNYVQALFHAGHAWHEKDMHNFHEELSKPGAGKAEQSLLAMERRRAEILIELLKEGKSN